MTQKNQLGFTLIELVLVIVILSIIATVASTKMDSIVLWKQRGQIRKFVATWEFLYREAFSRGVTYRLEIDFGDGQPSYSVLEEIPTPRGEVQEVDYLSNLRTKGEKQRRAKEENDGNRLSLDKAYELSDARQGDTLESLYYELAFNNPVGISEQDEDKISYQSNYKLAPPLDLPSLAQVKPFIDGLVIRDIKIWGKEFNSGKVQIRFSPKGASDFAIVHFVINQEVYTVMMNPSTGEVITKDGDVEFEWELDKKS